MFWAWETRRTIHQGFQSRRNETNQKDVPPTTLAFFLGLGFDTVTMEFWLLLDKAQIFAAPWGVDGETRWDEIVKFSEMALRELLFWAHDIVEMAT